MAIEIVDPDPVWPDRFAAERDAIEPTLRPWLAGTIEHIGSTAVAGLCAKPVIDILVPVRDREAYTAAKAPFIADALRAVSSYSRMATP